MNIVTFEQGEVTDIGGIHTSVRKLNSKLAELGYSCVVMTTNPKNKPSAELIDGFEIMRVKSVFDRWPFSLNPRLLFHVLRSIRSNRPEVVHVNHIRTLNSAALILLLAGSKIPFVFSPHYERGKSGTFTARCFWRIYVRAFRPLLRFPTAVVANAEYGKSLLIEDFHLDADRIRVIPHGVNKILVRDEQAQMERAKTDSISLLSAGVLYKKKGVEFILRALHQLKKDGTRATLTIIGNGECKRPLKVLANALDVEKETAWIDPVSDEDLEKRIRDCDVFLLLSSDESYGIVVAEALALGAPCIISRRTALMEFLNEPGCIGVDYPPEPKEVAAIVRRIVADNVKVGPLTDKIRTWDSVTEDYARLYHQLAAD
jgi:glycosyltransferase involved in cell wall biosynthesis